MFLGKECPLWIGCKQRKEKRASHKQADFKTHLSVEGIRIYCKKKWTKDIMKIDTSSEFLKLEKYLKSVGYS